jgi:glutamyl-tRNA synthetase
VRGRFAPSPTGELHPGNARPALLTWLQVRAVGGSLVMRIEDLDPLRSRPEFIASQCDDLRWLGLDWDEGPDLGGPWAPYLQSARSDLYDDALERLASQDRLFACICSRKDIAAASSAPHPLDEEGPRYPGTCRDRGHVALSSPAALRFRVPGEPIRFEDLVFGEQEFSLRDAGGDFVVRRKDGVAAYQLAVTVDDAAMRITHVLRGADLLLSTARQIALYAALGARPPVWAHVPLLVGPDGERLSKRHGSVSIRDIRDEGYSAEAVIGWLAMSCGLIGDAREVAAAELVEGFSLEQISFWPTLLDTLPFQPR